jgi:hypothetical protein
MEQAWNVDKLYQPVIFSVEKQFGSAVCSQVMENFIVKFCKKVRYVFYLPIFSDFCWTKVTKQIAEKMAIDSVVECYIKHVYKVFYLLSFLIVNYWKR